MLRAPQGLPITRRAPPLGALWARSLLVDAGLNDPAITDSLLQREAVGLLAWHFGTACAAGIYAQLNQGILR